MNTKESKMTNPSFPKANPPLHTVALVVTILTVCVSSIPNILSSIDTVATIQSCTTPLFPDLMSRATLGWIRLSFAVFIFLVTIYLMNQEVTMSINYMKGSKLRSLPVNFSGMKSQGFFTSWCWNILGLSFLCSGLVTLYIDQELNNNDQGISEDEMIVTLSAQPYIKYMLRMTVILFEIAAPLSMLVSAVVSYALWPKALRGKGSQDLKRWYILLQHNANVIMSLIEVGLLGGLTCRFTDIAVAPLFGVTFVLFAWLMKNKWLESGEPQFMYFFLDTTLGKTTSIALFGLLVILTLFYAIFVLVDDVILMLGGGLPTNLLVVFGTASLVCRFRD